MNKDVKNLLGSVAALLGSLVALAIVIWLFGAIIGAVGNWWGGLVKSWEPTAAQKAAQAKENEEWKTNPLNPEYIAQKCLDVGGFPTHNDWDGNVTCHSKDGGNKNVKIDIKQ